MIKNLNDIKKAYEKEIIAFINNHKELHDLIEDKYLHYTTNLNYSKNSKSYTFNITFIPNNGNEPDVTIPLLVNNGHVNANMLSLDTKEDELKMVNFIKGILEY